jgi:putative flavoprotein involved in K+ transport
VNDSTVYYDTLIIGGGQAGLATGYYLRQHNLNSSAGSKHHFTILDANPRTGDSWRNRWDSLDLFTSGRSNDLPGMPFPAPPNTFPSKDAMADYLEAYAVEMDLPVQTGVKVDRVMPADEGRNGYVVFAGDQRFEAAQIVVSTGAYQCPRLPKFTNELNPEIKQCHSSEYRNPSQLQEGGVLVVGAGNSGAEIALEVAGTQQTILAGRNPGSLPIRPDSPLTRLANPLATFLSGNLLNIKTSTGRKMRARIREHGQPVAWVKASDLEAAGVERIYDRVIGVRDGKPLLAGERVLDVTNVIWCTGFRRDFSLIDLPIFGDDGYPHEHRGVVPAAPGLYFVGLVFQSNVFSTLIGGVGKDAVYIVKEILARSSQPRQISSPGRIP